MKKLKTNIKRIIKKVLVFAMLVCLQDWAIIGGLISYAGGTAYPVSHSWDIRDEFTELTVINGSPTFDWSENYTINETQSARNKATIFQATGQADKFKTITYDAKRITQNEKLSVDYYYTVNSRCDAQWFGNKVESAENLVNYTTSETIKEEISGKEIGIRLSQNNPGECGIRWIRALNYKGQDIDIVFTFTNWEYIGDTDGYNPAMIIGYKTGRIGTWYTASRRLESLNYRINFYKTGTNQKATLKGVFTVWDIDGYECNGINPTQLEKIYLDKKTHLDANYEAPIIYLASKVDNNHLASQYEEENQCLEKYHQYSILIDTTKHSDIDIAYKYTYSPFSPSQATFLVEHLNTTQFLPFEVNTKLAKTITDSNETDVTSNTLQKIDEVFTYNVSYEIPPEQQSYTYYSGLYFEDSVDSRLTINSVKIYNEEGADKTSLFTVTTSNNKVTATAKNVATSSFYGTTYTMKINVQYKGAAPTNVPSLVFKNTAKVYVNEGNGYTGYSSNEVTTTAPVGYIKVTKKDSVTGNSVQGAVFGIFSNSACTTEVTRVTTGSDGSATTTLALNPGTYYVKEISAPANYKKSTDVKTATIPATAKGSYSAAIVPAEITNVPMGYIEITKKDSETDELLSGAKFGIYSDSNCTTQVTTLTTGSNGKAKTGLLDAGTYYIRELESPNNYTINREIKSIQITTAGATVSSEYKDVPNRGTIEAVKKDMLTGETVTTQETVFALYEWSVSSNTWIKPIHIDTSGFDGLVSDGIGYKLKEKTSGIKGTYKTGTLYYNASNAGKFKVVEYSAPFGYTYTEWEKDIVIDQDGKEVEGTVANSEVRGIINLKKLDKEVNYKNTNYGESYAQGDATLEGARYGLYAKEDIKSPATDAVIYTAGTKVEEKVTDANGKITWSNLYLGKYYVKEITPSTGYLIDSNEYEVDLTAYYRANYYNTGDRTTQVVTFKNTQTDTLYNNENGYVVSKETVIKQPLQIEKITSNIDLSDENIRVKNAKFKIYQVSKLDVDYNCTYADVINRYYNTETHKYVLPEEALAMTFSNNNNGTTIAEMITDENGQARSESLSYGRYVIIEVENAKDEQIEDVDTGLELARPFFINVTQNITDPLEERIITDPHMTAFVKVEKRDTRTGEIVKKTGAKYLIYKITTSNNEIDGEVLTREAVVQTVAYPNEQKVGTESNPYTTSEEGTFTTPVSLDVGLYELVEVSAPDEYVLSGYEGYTENGVLKNGYIYNGRTVNKVQDVVKFKIATTEVYEEDPNLATPGYNGGNKNGNKITVEQYNSPQMGTLTINKRGEVLANTDTKENGLVEFRYTEAAIGGASFSVYAAEDIYTNDNQTDSEGNRTKYYSKDQIVAEVTTNSNGVAYVDNLPLGKYYIKETSAGEGFVLNKETKYFEMSVSNLDINKLVEGEVQKTPVIYRATEKEGEVQTVQSFKNERQKVEIRIIKTDKEQPDTRVTGAEFRLYVAEDIKNVDGEVIAPTGTLVGIATSDSEGYATFDVDIPFGKYYVKEEKGPTGYSTNKNAKIELNAEYLGQDIEAYMVEDEIRNSKTKLRVQILDDETEKGLEGTAIIIKDEDGNVIREGKVGTDGTILIEGLEKNKVYYIEEVEARENYINDQIIRDDSEGNELEKTKLSDGTIKFTLQDVEETQTVTIYNLSKVGTLEIEKTGEVLADAEKDEDGKITFKYGKQKIDTAEFELYAKEDIVHPDGKTGVIVTAGTKVAEGYTENGVLKLTNYDENVVSNTSTDVQKLLNRGLALGNYHLKETKAPQGYYLDPNNNIINVTIKSTGNNDVENDTTTIEIENIRQSINAGGEASKLTISKEAEKDVYNPGEEAVYKIVVKNEGTTLIKNIEVIETLLDGNFDELEGTEKVDNQTMKIEKLEAGKGLILTYRYKIPEDSTGIIENKVKAIGTPVIPSDDPNEPEKDGPPIEDVDTERTGIKGEYGVMVRKTANKDNYEPGETAEYKIEVINTGRLTLEELEVKDELGIGTFKEQEGITISEENTAIIESLKENEKIVLTYEVVIPETEVLGSTIENKVKVTGKVEDPEDPENPIPVGDEDTETVDIEEDEAGIGLYKIDEETKEALKGAEFGLYSAEDVTVGDKVILEKDELIATGISDLGGMVRFGSEYPLGKYYIKEITAPDGYAYDDTKIEVDTTELAQSKKAYNVKVDKLNKQTEVQVLKIEMLKNNSEISVIEGAKMQILDGDTKEIVLEWTTEKEPTIIKKLSTEKVYILHEKEPAPGYVSANDIQFSISKEGKLIIKQEDTLENYENTIVMQDDVTKVKINFVDEKTKKQLPDGKLEIRDKDGKVVTTIDTEEEAWYIEKLLEGEYTIVPIEVPEGYDSAEEIKLIVKDTTDIQEVTVLVKRKLYDLGIEKFISKVTVNEATVLTGTNTSELQKVEINRKQIQTAKVRIEYTIRITNKGEIDGKIGEITDTLPKGVTFIASENEDYWKVNGNTISTDKYKDEELKAGQSKDIKIVVAWTNTEFGAIQNKVSIESGANKYEFEDANEENNEATATLLITVSTGAESIIFNIILLSAIVGLAIGIVKYKKHRA